MTMPSLYAATSLPGHAQWQFLAKVLDWPGYWAGLSGGDASVGVSEQRDGGQDEPDLILGRGTHSNIVLRRPFKPRRDMLIQSYRPLIPKRYVKAIILQPTDASFDDADNDKLVFTNGLLLRIGTPVVDADSETGSSYETEWRVPRSAVFGASATKY
jgi:hypothetical protein